MGLNIRPGTSAEEIAALTMQALGQSQGQALPPVQGPANMPPQGPPAPPRDILGGMPMAGITPAYIPGAPTPAAPAAPQPQQGGFLGRLRNPDMQAKLMAFGQGMSQLAAGQAPNIAANPAYQAMMQRRSETDQRKQMEGLLEDLPPELRKVVAAMPPGLGQKVIYDYILEKMKPPAPVAPVKGINVGGKLVNPVTGDIIYEGEPEVEGSVRALQQRAELLGLEPGSPEYNEFIKAGSAPSTTVNVGGPGETEFQKKSAAAAAERFDGYITAARGSQEMLGDLEALAGIATNIDTGKSAQVLATLGPYANALGLEVTGLSEAEAFNAITDRMAPQMRPPGSGASSDRDVQQFLNSLPNLGKTPEGNRIIQETFAALHQHRIEAGAIAEQVLRGQLSWQDGEAAISELGNPYAAFSKYAQRSGYAGRDTRAQGATVNVNGTSYTVEALE